MNVCPVSQHWLRRPREHTLACRHICLTSSHWVYVLYIGSKHTRTHIILYNVGRNSFENQASLCHFDHVLCMLVQVQVCHWCIAPVAVRWPNLFGMFWGGWLAWGHLPHQMQWRTDHWKFFSWNSESSSKVCLFFVWISWWFDDLMAFWSKTYRRLSPTSLTKSHITSHHITPFSNMHQPQAKCHVHFTSIHKNLQMFAQLIWKNGPLRKVFPYHSPLGFGHIYTSWLGLHQTGNANGQRMIFRPRSHKRLYEKRWHSLRPCEWS